MTQLSLIRPLGNAGTPGTMPQFPRDIDQEVSSNMSQLQRMPNERALLSRLFAQIGSWDPDVIVGHNARSSVVYFQESLRHWSIAVVP
jgi:DNA polymerase alpha subunit A